MVLCYGEMPLSNISVESCVRAILWYQKSASSSIFKQLGILKFQDIYELHTNVFIFYFVNGGLPNPISWVYTSITETYMNIIHIV